MTTNEITNIAQALSDSSRATMVSALLNDRSLTANELANHAGVSPQGASFHLKALVNAGLLTAYPNGRHRYFKLASGQVKHLIQSMIAISPITKQSRTRKHTPEICFARTCYGHLAGFIGTALTDTLIERNYLSSLNEKDFALTTSGESFLTDLGIDVVALRKSRKRLASCCLDWTERRPHVGGAVGFGLMSCLKEKNWMEVSNQHRTVSITKKGRLELYYMFGINVEELETQFYQAH